MTLEEAIKEIEYLMGRGYAMYESVGKIAMPFLLELQRRRARDKRVEAVLKRCCVSSRRGTVCVICGQLIKDLENPAHAPDCELAALLQEDEDDGL